MIWYKFQESSSGKRPFQADQSNQMKCNDQDNRVAFFYIFLPFHTLVFVRCFCMAKKAIKVRLNICSGCSSTLYKASCLADKDIMIRINKISPTIKNIIWK